MLLTRNNGAKLQPFSDKREKIFGFYATKYPIAFLRFRYLY